MFAGFSREALDFLSAIRMNNNQAFYEQNRAQYEQFLKTPLRELSDEMAPVIRAIDARLDTRPGRTMSRIRRDTRFSRDKSPFRDHVWLGWRYPGESRSDGFGLFWGFGPDWLSWGAGSYAPDKPLMDALRLHIRSHPDEVREAVFHPRLAGRYELFGEDYKKLAVPEDVPQDLRSIYVKKRFGIEHEAAAEEWQMLHTHEMADLLAAELEAMAPLQQLMQRMRKQADYAQAQQARERQAQQREAAKQADAPRRVTVRSAEDFDF